MPFNALKRRPQSAFSEVRRFLYNAFILPCKDVQRAYLYFTSIIFAFSASFLDLFIVIDLIDLTAWEMIRYQVIKNAGVSLVVVILLFMIAKYGGKLIYPFITAMLSAAMILCLFWPYELQPWLLGFIFVLVNAPFWSLYHTFFAISVSDENVGNEVSLAGTGMTVGMALGFAAGGYLQSINAGIFGLVLGFGGMSVGTCMLIYHAYKLKLRDMILKSGALDEKIPEAFKRCRYRSIGSLLEGVMQTGGGALWPIFLSFAGVTAVAVGIWNAVMVLVKIIFTPIAGSLINHGKRREMLMGSAVTAVGWVPFIFTTTFALPAMYIWSVGNQLFASGLGSAWYQSRTIASLIAREIILGLSRLIFIPIMILILYHDASLFIYFMVGSSLLMILYSLYWVKSIKIKGPSMPIEATLSVRR